VVLPLFALANAGVRLNGDILLGAMVSPVAWGVVAGLVVGKFVGVFGSTALLRVLRIGDFGPGLTVDRLAGGAALCGIGFTISLFIVDLAIPDPTAQNAARVGVLAATIIAFVVATIVFRISDARQPKEEIGLRLVRPVDPARDHIYGSLDAPFEIVEYGDFQCGFCLKATGSVVEVQRELGDGLRYVWRHAPLTRFHPNALAAAEASEAAARQGKFFEFERSLFADQEHQLPSDIVRRAEELGLDVRRFEADLASPEVAARVRDDMLDAEAMDITAVPTFFINGRRHVGPYDAQSLIRALQAAAEEDRAEQPRATS
jgi:protein-disulfide isomerase